MAQIGKELEEITVKPEPLIEPYPTEEPETTPAEPVREPEKVPA